MNVADTCLPYVKIPSRLFPFILHGLNLLEKGVLFALICFCAQVRNGGRIAGCRRWTRTEWERMVGSRPVRAVIAPCLSSMLAWDGDDLLVLAYDAAEEQKALIRAEKASAAARAMHAARAAAHPAPGMPEENSTEAEGEKNSGGGAPARATYPNDLDEVLSFAASLPSGMKPADVRECAAAFFNNMLAVGWRDSRNRPIIFWKPAFQAYLGKWESRLRSPRPASAAERPTCNHNCNAGHADEYDI